MVTTKTRGRETVADSLGELANLLLNSVEKEDANPESIFEEEPVDLATFLYDAKYLDMEIRLSPPQFEFVDTCSRIFEDQGPIFTEGVLQCGQGSGKDMCSILVCLRTIYLLQCLKSPQSYFNQSRDSFIDLINIAQSARAAKNIFFDSLKSYMRNSPWFKELKRKALERGDVFDDKSSEIVLPKNMRMVSSTSDNESWQGYTPIVVVLDEIDAFKSDVELQANRSLRKVGADGVYDTALTLVQSRFPNYGKVLSLSWPRFKGSFIQRRFVQGKEEPQTYVACREDGRPYATWDFNPTKTRDMYADLYQRRPQLSRAQYECDPGYASDAFFKEPVYVLEAFDAFFNQYEFVERTGDRPLRELNMLIPKMNYYIHVDLGLSEANAALCITHREEDKIVIDRIEVWEPPPDAEIDISGVENYILDLKNAGYNIIQCTYDSYQSAQTLQNLERAGIMAGRKSVDRTAEAYHTLKDVIQQGNLDGYFDREAIVELLSLDILPNNKIAKRPGMLKDRADAIAGSVHNAVMAGSTFKMKGVSNMNDIFVKEEAQNKEGMYDSATGTLVPKTNAHGLLEITNACLSCKNINCLEYSNFGGRTTNPLDANKMWCLYCSDVYVAIDEEWVLESELVGV